MRRKLPLRVADQPHLADIRLSYGPRRAKVAERSTNARVIIHTFPLDHISSEQLRHAFDLKFLQALSTCNGGESAVFKRWYT